MWWYFITHLCVPFLAFDSGSTKSGVFFLNGCKVGGTVLSTRPLEFKRSKAGGWSTKREFSFINCKWNPTYKL